MTKKNQNTSSEKDLNTAIAELRAIASWFESQDEVDVELGLEKIKHGAVLIKECRARLKNLENSFEEVRKELDAEE
jgi:exonuclease VII small subunit